MELKQTASILDHIALPKMFCVQQNFDPAHLTRDEIKNVVAEEIHKENICSRLHAGMRIAVTAGSRGIANYRLILQSLIDEMKRLGCSPFIIPAMGSHGGADAEGQRKILEDFGITEKTCGCPIVSSMETVCVGQTPDGRNVYIDSNAAKADGIIVFCRIKPHTSFHGRYESGIMKMMVIGMGKQKGAQYCHQDGFPNMEKNLLKFGKVILNNAPILFSLVVVENAYDDTCKIEAVPRENILDREPGLLQEARNRMPRILVDSCDVLIVDQIGKNFSGDGMDPNITGTNRPYISNGINAQYAVVLGISEESHGNGMGIGHAVVTTHRTAKKLDLDAMYVNALTCKLANGCNIPVQVENDRQAIQFALGLCIDFNAKNPRIVRIANSSDVRRIMLSEAYLNEIGGIKNLIIESEPQPIAFDEDGYIIPFIKK